MINDTVLRNKFLFVILGIVIFILSLLYIWKTTQDKPQHILSFDTLQDRELVTIVFDSQKENDNNNDYKSATEESTQKISVEIVNTPSSTTLGLSGREKIGADGMLFIFPEKSTHYFWMKDMQFDLDLIWLAENKVVEITKGVPKPELNTSDNRLKTYGSQMAVDMVLEVVAGDAQKFDINVGDTIQLVE